MSMATKSPNVLLAYDRSEPSRRALDRIRTLMADASVAVVTVAPPVYKDRTASQFADEPDAKWQQEALAEAKALLAQSGIEARGAAPVGREADEIVRLAKESGADLIVLGARGLNPLKRLVLGSVSTNVLHHAPCDVLVVK